MYINTHPSTILSVTYKVQTWFLINFDYSGIELSSYKFDSIKTSSSQRERSRNLDSSGVDYAP